MLHDELWLYNFSRLLLKRTTAPQLLSPMVLPRNDFMIWHSDPVLIFGIRASLDSEDSALTSLVSTCQCFQYLFHWFFLFPSHWKWGFSLQTLPWFSSSPVHSPLRLWFSLMLKIQIWISSQGSFSKCEILITTCLLVSQCPQIIFWSFPTPAPPGCFPQTCEWPLILSDSETKKPGRYPGSPCSMPSSGRLWSQRGKLLGLSPDPSSSISNLDCHSFLQDGFSGFFPSFSSLFLKVKVCFPNYKDPKSPHLT